MTNANDKILDSMTTRALDLQRLAAGQARDVSRFLKALEGDIVAQLAKVDPTGIGSISRRQARLEKLLKQVKVTIVAAYRSEGKRLANELREIADMEARFAASAINKGAGVQLITTELTRGQLVAITGDLLVQGAPVSDWLSRQAGDTLKRFQDNMRLGIAQGETNSQLMRRIRGGKQNGEVVQGFMNVTRNHADSLVRSATQAVSQASRQAVYNDNDDLIKGEQWLSTIDLRTTIECSARDGLTYTVGTHEPIDHSLPWGGGPGNLHWGCRSTSTPVLKSFRELGLDIDEVPLSTRSSLDGQIPQDTTFEGWLSRRTVKEQNENLGVGRAKLWRDGNISFRDLMDANGRPLSLDELRAKAGMGAATVAPRVFSYQSFKGVKNVAQAEAYLTDKGITSVANLKGLSAKGMSKAVGAAHEVTERFGLEPLAYMGPISRDTRYRYKGIKNANAAVYPTTKAMHLPTKFGDLKDPERQIASKLRQAKGYAAERARRIAADKRIDGEVLSRVEKMGENDYTWSITMADGASERAKTMYHEYGHVLHKIDLKVGPLIDDFLLDVKPRLSGWDLLASKYAGSNDAEYIAETFAIYMAKPKSEHYRIHPKLLSIYQKADRKNDPR
jgi:hydroxyethylthiazole kinase-like sugar kinase family protein